MAKLTVQEAIPPLRKLIDAIDGTRGIEGLYEIVAHSLKRAWHWNESVRKGGPLRHPHLDPMSRLRLKDALDRVQDCLPTDKWPEFVEGIHGGGGPDEPITALSDRVQTLRLWLNQTRASLKANRDAQLPTDSLDTIRACSNFFSWALADWLDETTTFIDDLQNPIGATDLARRAGYGGKNPGDHVSREMKAAWNEIRPRRAWKKIGPGQTRTFTHDDLRAVFPHLPTRSRLKKFLAQHGLGNRVEQMKSG